MSDSAHKAETVEALAHSPPAEPDIHASIERLTALADEQRAAAALDLSVPAGLEPAAHAEIAKAAAAEIGIPAAGELAHTPNELMAAAALGETAAVEIAAHVAAEMAAHAPVDVPVPAAMAAPAAMPRDFPAADKAVAPAPVEMLAPAEPAARVEAPTAVLGPGKTALQAAAIVIPLATPAAARRSPVAHAIYRMVTVIGALLPYSLVAIGLRFVMAQVFFLSGQAKIEGPVYPIEVPGFDLMHGFSLNVTLPMAVKNSTYAMFDQMASLPIPSWIAAPVVSYAEFILPICLVLGFATRFAALGLLIGTVMIAAFVLPDALWTTHIYWASILLVLVSLGSGAVSIDHLIRRLYER